MELYALQIGKVDWDTYVKVCKDFLHESPTRGIDAAGVKLDNPIAFLKTLDFNNQPQVAMASEHLYSHLFFSFIMVIDLVIISKMSERTDLSVAFVENRGKALTLVSGTLRQWKYAVIYSCSETADIELRGVFNEIMVRLETAGFKEVWSEYARIPKSDGTTVLKRR